MSSTWIEQTRQSLEALEQIDRSITDFIAQKAKEFKDQVILDHKINNLIELKQQKCQESVNLLNDSENLKKDEIAILSGQKSLNPQTKHPDVWSNFYEKLKEIREYHRKYNPQLVNNNTSEYFKETIFNPPFKPPVFSGEENNGKFVDMYHLYQEFINMKSFFSDEQHRVDYQWYLQNFDEFHEISFNAKEKEFKKYKRYLENVAAYLKGFYQRVYPLKDFEILEEQINKDFEEKWKEGTLKGWERRIDEDQDMQQNPLYCIACTKLFANENTFIHHISGKRHKKNSKLGEKNIKTGVQEEEEKQQSVDTRKENQNDKDEKNEIEELDVTERKKRKLAVLENFIIQVKESIVDIIQETKNEITLKQTQLPQERNIEVNQTIEPEDIDEDAPPYNPKNLPLGWDGKPIPYWLYKLHGLGIEYKCEICGNYSYWGRRAFEKHFSEWRHAFGMKCLKIPNSIHFKEITSINDALTLHQKLIMESECLNFKPETEEEFEDSEGNLLNKKTYNDLKRQGLL